MEYLMAWEVPLQGQVLGKGRANFASPCSPTTGEDGIGHICTKMCNLEKSNVRLVER